MAYAALLCVEGKQVGDRPIEEMSPFGNIVAYAEDDGATVYFYLFFKDAEKSSPEQFKACWVRNRKSPPHDIDRGPMIDGQAPLMPRRFCRHAEPQPPLRQDALRIVWLEEADAAALLEGPDILAAIPAWSGAGGFNGYARDCVGESPFAWELGPENVIRDRVKNAAQFWQLWEQPDFWQKWRDERIAAAESAFGRHSKYYAIDGGEFPPHAMLRFDQQETVVLLTIGVSLFCVPKVEQYFEDPSPYRRIELAACLDRRCPESELAGFGQYISAQARYPWTQFVPLGSGHSMPCDSTPKAFGGARFDHIVLTHSLDGTPKIQFPQFRGDPTNVLWILPISEPERDLAVEKGTDVLLQNLTEAGVDYVIHNRQPVV
jgi:hypothetical protein